MGDFFLCQVYIWDIPSYDVHKIFEEGGGLSQMGSDIDPVSDLGSGGIIQRVGLYMRLT